MMQRLLPPELKFCFVLFGCKSSQVSLGPGRFNNVEEYEVRSRDLRQLERMIDCGGSVQINGDENYAKFNGGRLGAC